MATEIKCFTERYWQKRGERHARGEIGQCEMNSCVVCGRKINPCAKSTRFVLLDLDNAPMALKAGEGLSDEEVLGFFPIGPECRRGLPRGYAATRTEAGF